MPIAKKSFKKKKILSKSQFHYDNHFIYIILLYHDVNPKSLQGAFTSCGLSLNEIIIAFRNRSRPLIIQGGGVVHFANKIRSGIPASKKICQEQMWPISLGGTKLILFKNPAKLRSRKNPTGAQQTTGAHSPGILTVRSLEDYSSSSEIYEL